MPNWDDSQYLKFADERTRAARELLGRVPVPGARRVVDLGCGPGNSTALLRDRWPDARLTGVDSSREMLERARKDYPGVEWLEADAATYVTGEPVDVLFANALLQWIPDHARLVPALFAQVAPGGALAFQVPNNFDQPSHRLMRATPGPWSSRTANVRAANPIASAATYYDLLAPRARSVDIWHTTYEHVMADAPAIVDWVKGTGLRPFLEALGAEERPAFLEAYTQAIDAAYPPRTDGKRLFSFPRLFVVAVRAGT
jgi:trans-aconitate 2-methyltransferase